MERKISVSLGLLCVVFATSLFAVPREPVTHEFVIDDDNNVSDMNPSMPDTNDYTPVPAPNSITNITKFWTGIPIEIDDDKNTYTIVGDTPRASIQYYYYFGGYRCLPGEMKVDSYKWMILKPNQPNGFDLYCYSE